VTQRINYFLHSEAALLVLLGLALISQVPHTATVFHRISQTTTGAVDIAAWIHAGFYAVALEFATLIFVVRGQTKLAWTFAVVSVLVNMAYYATHIIAPVDIAAALLVSFALPFVIATYSHNVSHDAGQADALEAPQTGVEASILSDSGEAVHTVVYDATSDSSAIERTENESLSIWQQQALQHRSEGLKAPTIAKMVGKSNAAVYALFNKYPEAMETMA